MQGFGTESMIPSLEITFLGTGPSTGVPVMTCECPVCTSGDPKNSRLRASIHLKTPEAQLLVDTGPDLRTQSLKYGITRADAVLYTHAHMDHITGFDDLRAFCWRRDDPLPLFTAPGTLKTLQQMFAWAFSPDNTYKGYVKPGPVTYDGAHQIGDVKFEAVPVEHGSVETVGIRFDHPSMEGGFAYLPDVKSIPDSSLEKLRDLDTLVIDTLRDTEHPTHLSLSEALQLIEVISPRRAFLTHLSHDFDYAELSSRLPDGVHVAYDGMKLTYP